ncbi:hypothetical protein Adt_24769 [Abeliophyllum distichum]|uniref:Uncharacterized protein n=1 Tax=Abeliophyllum distichum TaxID=126358 RepID=A0ABD1SEQ5_9LAMI
MNRARTRNRQTPILPVTQSDNPPSKPTRVHRVNPRLSVQTPRHVKPSTYDCLHCNYVLFVIGAVLTFAANVTLTYVDFFTYDVSGYLLMKLMHIGNGGQTPVNLDEGNQADGGVGKGCVDTNQIKLACTFSTIIHFAYFIIMWKIHPWLRRKCNNKITIKCWVSFLFGSGLDLAAAYGALYFEKMPAMIYTILLGTSLLVLLASDKADEDFGLLDGITALALGVVVRVPEHQFAVPAVIAIGFSLRHFIPLLGSKKELAFGRLERYEL